MKILKSDLRRIIKEELQNVLKEQEAGDENLISAIDQFRTIWLDPGAYPSRKEIAEDPRVAFQALVFAITDLWRGRGASTLFGGDPASPNKEYKEAMMVVSQARGRAMSDPPDLSNWDVDLYDLAATAPGKPLRGPGPGGSAVAPSSLQATMLGTRTGIKEQHKWAPGPSGPDDDTDL